MSEELLLARISFSSRLLVLRQASPPLLALPLFSTTVVHDALFLACAVAFQDLGSYQWHLTVRSPLIYEPALEQNQVLRLSCGPVTALSTAERP